MIDERELRDAQLYAVDKLAEAGIVLTREEGEAVEVADSGLSRLAEPGLQLVVYMLGAPRAGTVERRKSWPATAVRSAPA